jgi:hypothetical protein
MSTSINVNSTQISALLQLYPMAIPGAEENLQPPGAYHLGIPESIHSPSTNLFMVIDPVTLFSTPFAAGDSVRLWVNGLATSVIKPIKPGEENDRIFMELLWGWLKDGLNTLYYEVTRVSGNKDKSDPILNVLFNNPVSGITVSHPASIGPGQPATFTLTRSNPREFDVVMLTVGAWSKTIPYVHSAKPITYTLTTIDLQQIGDGTHTVNATIKDQLSNLRVSPTTSIVITANQPLIVPKLISVLDATGNDVPEGSTTRSTSLTLHGEASPERQVEIYDGSGPSAVPKGKVTADPTTGKWVLTITVPSGARRLYAKSLYHPTNTYSNVRNLTVNNILTENFDNYPRSIISKGQSIDTQHMLVTFLNGDGFMGIDYHTFPDAYAPEVPGKSSGQVFHMWYKAVGVGNGIQRARMDFKSTCSEVSFWYTWLESSTRATVYFFGSSNQMLGFFQFIPNGVNPQLVEFSDLGIVRMEIETTQDWISIDHLALTLA